MHVATEDIFGLGINILVLFPSLSIIILIFAVSRIALKIACTFQHTIFAVILDNLWPHVYQTDFILAKFHRRIHLLYVRSFLRI